MKNKINIPKNMETRGVDDLIPYAQNAKKHSEDQVKKIANSIKTFGFNAPILIDDKNNIIAGHGRLMAAKHLDMKDVPVVVLAHMKPEEQRAYILADNRLTELSEWDRDVLSAELLSLHEASFDIGLTGFDQDWIIRAEEEGKTDEDAVPEEPVRPVTALGDVWLLGDHRVMCGDSTVMTDVEKLMNDRKADAFITDPPYNVNYEGSTGLKIQNDSMEDTTFRQFLRDAFVTADAVMKAGAVFYIWHADLEGYNFRGACRDAGWQVRQTLIWNKQAFVMGRQDYHWKHEPCLYGWKDGAAHLWAADRKQSTVIEFDKPKSNSVHPTMKPVELMQYQVENNTKGGDIVLDLFGGSGSTLIACQKVGRHCYMMELDPKYCDVIVKRWEEYTGEKAVHAETGQPFSDFERGE